MFVEPRSGPARSRCAKLCRCRTTASLHRWLLPAPLRRVAVASLVLVLLPLLPRVLLVLAVLAAVAVPGEVDRMTQLLVPPPVLTQLLVPPPVRVLSLAALLAPVLALHRLRVLRRILPPVVQEESLHWVRAKRLSSDLCHVVRLALAVRLLVEQRVATDRWDPKCVGCPALEVLARKPGMSTRLVSPWLRLEDTLRVLWCVAGPLLNDVPGRLGNWIVWLRLRRSAVQVAVHLCRLWERHWKAMHCAMSSVCRA